MQQENFQHAHQNVCLYKEAKLGSKFEQDVNAGL